MFFMKRLVTLLLIAAVLSGCTTASQRFVAFPTQGQPPDQQILDRGQCEDIATMHKGSDADAAVAMGSMGLAVGVVSGAAYGAVLGGLAAGISAGHGSLVGLAVGAVFGLTMGIVQGVAENQARYQRIYLACMTARNYVLGG
jgi:hypothetical protein